MSHLLHPQSCPKEAPNPDALQEDVYVCWSRMQAEAGQSLEMIIARKELERQAGGGLFMWGGGNAPSRAINPLARLRISVPVVFSTMKSKPKAADLAPSRIVVWRQYFDEHGIERPLPTGALVISRGDSAGGAKTRHYALMCYSDTPLEIEQGTPFDPSAFRNASGTGAQVGASQVTALLRQVSEPSDALDYEANIVAQLTEGYWVRLSDPLELSMKAVSQISEFAGDTEEWLALVDRVRGRVNAQSGRIEQGNTLL